MRRDTTKQSASELESMSVQQNSVVIEQNAAHLSSQLEGDAPWTIHGIAIGEGDVTRGQSGIRKKWPREALKPAVDSLEGRSLVEDHDNSSRGVVGEVIATKYEDGVGVLYEAELYDEELAKRVKNGLLEVSIRGYHGDVENMDETEEGAKLIQRVKFDNLSIVPSGAAPSNTAEMGPSSELSPAECAEMMGVELQEFKEGDFVLAGMNNNVLSNQEDPTPARIEEVVFDGVIQPDDISNSNPVSGTEQNPAALLRVYEYSEGEWSPGDTLVAKRFSALQPWEAATEEASEHGEMYSEGDLVMWEWSDGQAHGRVAEVFDEPGEEINRTIDGNEVTRTVEEDRPVYELEVWREDDEEFRGTALKYHDKLNMWSDAPEAAEMRELTISDSDTLYADSLKANIDYIDDGHVPVVGYTEHLSEEELQEEIDDVYSEWSDHVNMSASELQRWSENPCSREASVDPTAVMERNLRLLEKNKEDWTSGDVEDAKRTISFISRMSDEENRPDSPMDGSNGCPTDWAISLLNWAYNPFDSLPEIPEEMESMEPVELRYSVPEGAEFEGNPNKEDEEPERYPEGEDTPQEDRQGMDEFDEEAAESVELADYSMHEPEWDGEHTNDWNRPNLEDFASEYDFETGQDFAELNEDTRSAIGNHFLIARGGFPAEDYGDLKLPVVEPDGRLSLNALSAVKGGRGATAVDGLSSEMESRIMQWVNETAGSVFDKDWGEEEAAEAPEFSEGDMVEWQVNPELFGKIVHVDDEKDIVMVEVHEMDGDEPSSTGFTITAGYSDLRKIGSTDEMSGEPADDADEPADAGDKAGENDDTVTVLSADRSIPVTSDDEGTGNEPITIVAADNTGDSNMTDEITEDELEELRQKANAYDELEEGDYDGVDPSEAVEELREEFQSDLEELKERTAILDEVDRSDVEALQNADEPYVMEREKYEQLEEDVESVRSLYAEALSERTGVPAERIEDKWTLEEMREDLEDELDEGEELEGELTPDPQGADPEEEELEEAAEVEAGNDDSPSEEASEKQEEIRQRILE